MRFATIRFSALLASCLLAVNAFAADTAPLDMESPKPAPTIIFKGADSASQTLDPAKARLTAVHFWATWCVPCVGELPEVDAAAKAYKDKGLRVVAISLDSSLEKVPPFFAAHHITALTPAMDVNMSSFMAAHLAGLPGTIFIDKDGKEIARARGPLDWKSKQVTNFIESHLK